MGKRLFRLKEPEWELFCETVFGEIVEKRWVWENGLATYTVNYQKDGNLMGDKWTLFVNFGERDSLHKRCADLEDGQKWCLEDFLGRMENDFEEVECE